MPPTGGKLVPIVQITFQSNNPQHLHDQLIISPENDTDTDISLSTDVSPNVPIESDNSSDIVPVNTDQVGSSFFTAFPAIPSDHQESSGSPADNSTEESSSFNLTFPGSSSDKEESRSQADNSSNSNSFPTHDFSFFSSFPAIPGSNEVSLSSFFPSISLEPDSAFNIFPEFDENLNFLFGKPEASPAPAGNNVFFGRPEKQILTNVAAQANLREGPKFFFGPTKSEEEDFDETAEIVEEETRTEGQSNFSQVNISQLSDLLQGEKRENKTHHLKSTTEGEGEEDKISEELDIASLFEDYNSTSDHFDYELSNMLEEYLMDIWSEQKLSLTNH